MLKHNDKIEILKSYLSEEKYNYADSFKTYSKEEDLHDRSPLHPEG